MPACLSSVRWADELLVLDSGSCDDTQDIAARFGAVIHQQAFAGYGPQKQAALDLTTHRWVLLMDADEALSLPLQDEIRSLLASGPKRSGYRMPRREQMFWQLQHPGTRMNHFLRLFDRQRGRISTMPIHAAPEVDGPIGTLRGCLLHYGEISIHAKTERINHYSTGLVADKQARGSRWCRTRMLLYPPWVFLKSWLFKRNFLNGWAGWIASVSMAHYAFLKYAKLYEASRSSLQPLIEPQTEPAPQSSGGSADEL